MSSQISQLNQICKFLVIDGIHISRCNIENCESHKKVFINTNDENEVECSICYSNLDINLETPLHCGHIFHKNCINLSKQEKCPYCSENFNDDEKKYFQIEKDRNQVANQVENQIANQMHVQELEEIAIERIENFSNKCIFVNMKYMIANLSLTTFVLYKTLRK